MKNVNVSERYQISGKNMLLRASKHREEKRQSYCTITRELELACITDDC